jgi:hypothetical protein
MSEQDSGGQPSTSSGAASPHTDSSQPGNRAGRMDSEPMVTTVFAPGEPIPDMQLALPKNRKSTAAKLGELFSAMVSIAMLAAVVLEVRHLQFREIIELIPHKPLFWMVFVPITWSVRSPNG